MDRRVASWCLYDFANSSYSAVIAAVVFPVFFTTVIVGNETGQGDLWWGRAISLSMAVVALSSPVLGGIADYAGKRKSFLLVYSLLCIASVAAFLFLTPGMAATAFMLVVAANIGMEGAIVFYNSFLPVVSPPSHIGRVSAWGFGIGYLGSILSLVFALLLIEAGRTTMVWPMVAAFFLLFSLPAYMFLPSDPGNGRRLGEGALQGMQRTMSNLRNAWEKKDLRRFLIAYLVYEDGVNTVIVFSSIFAATTLGFSSKELVVMYLTVQFAALAGAFIMARKIDTWGPKRVVVLSLFLWTGVSVAAYFTMAKWHFFAVAACAGTGLGTVQAASRALYVRFIPKGMESEYFGIYSLVGKSSAVLGPLLFGYMSVLSGSQRPAVLSVALLFLAGLVIITTVNTAGSAGNDHGGAPGNQEISDN